MEGLNMHYLLPTLLHMILIGGLVLVEVKGLFKHFSKMQTHSHKGVCVCLR